MVTSQAVQHQQVCVPYSPQSKYPPSLGGVVNESFRGIFPKVSAERYYTFPETFHIFQGTQVLLRLCTIVIGKKDSRLFEIHFFAICATRHCLALSFAPLLSSLGPAFLFSRGKEKSAFWAYFSVTGRLCHNSCMPYSQLLGDTLWWGSFEPLGSYSLRVACLTSMC